MRCASSGVIHRLRFNLAKRWRACKVKCTRLCIRVFVKQTAAKFVKRFPTPAGLYLRWCFSTSGVPFVISIAAKSVQIISKLLGCKWELMEEVMRGRWTMKGQFEVHDNGRWHDWFLRRNLYKNMRTRNPSLSAMS